MLLERYTINTSPRTATRGIDKSEAGVGFSEKEDSNSRRPEIANSPLLYSHSGSSAHNAINFLTTRVSSSFLLKIAGSSPLGTQRRTSEEKDDREGETERPATERVTRKAFF